MSDINKDLRINGLFLANLCLAEAALRPFINDWAHLEPEEEQSFRDCLGVIIDLQHQARAYENYLYKQIRDTPAVRTDGGADEGGVERLSDEEPATTGEQNSER